MTAPDSVPLHALTEDNLASASPDLLRAMIKMFADALMSAEADALCDAEYGRSATSRPGPGSVWGRRFWSGSSTTWPARWPRRD